MIAYLLESSPSSIEKCCVLFSNYLVFAKQLPVYFLPYEREQEDDKCIPPKHFRVSGIKISNVMTKETSHYITFPNIAADTVALSETANKFS